MLESVLLLRAVAEVGSHSSGESDILSELASTIQLSVFAGFFVNQNNIPDFLKPFQYISIFKYGYQALMLVRL